jgi:hypothetical protein
MLTSQTSGPLRIHGRGQFSGAAGPRLPAVPTFDRRALSSAGEEEAAGSAYACRAWLDSDYAAQALGKRTSDGEMGGGKNFRQFSISLFPNTIFS